MTAPRAIEAEALILGALLDSDLVKAKADELVEAAGLGPEDFTDARVRLCFQAATRLAEHGRPVDATTVYMAAKVSGRLDDSALSWLQTLQARNTLDKASFGQVAESFRQATRARVVIAQLRQLVNDLEQRKQYPGQISEQLESMAGQLTAQWAPDQWGDADVLEVLAEWALVGESGGRGLIVPTGLPAIDDVIGGWSPNLNLVIGQPSVGKSALIGACIEAELKRGLCVGLFGLEDGVRWLSRRLVAKRLEVPVKSIGREKPTPVQEMRLPHVGNELGALMRDKLRTFRFSGIAVDELCRRAVQWVRAHGVQVLYVDHLGVIGHTRRQGMDHRLSVAQTLFRLRALAQRHNVPVVLVAHTKRPQEGGWTGRPPALTEIAETADAERAAFKVLGLWEKGNRKRATVLKDKEGERDVTIELEMLTEAALVSDAGGGVVNLHEERRKERNVREAEREAREKRRREERFAEAQERKAKAKADKEAAKKAEKAKPPEQQELLPEEKA